MHAAWDDGRIVGGAGAFSFELSVPGGSVPAAGVTVVGVSSPRRRCDGSPHHRRPEVRDHLAVGATVVELLWLLAEPRRMQFRLNDGLWVRLLDVEAALSARS